jgi:hypothetical protein
VVRILISEKEYQKIEPGPTVHMVRKGTWSSKKSEPKALCGSQDVKLITKTEVCVNCCCCLGILEENE